MKLFLAVLFSLSSVSAVASPAPSRTPTFLCAVTYVYSGSGPSWPLMHGTLSSGELKDDLFTYSVEANSANPNVVMLSISDLGNTHLPLVTSTGVLRQSGDYLSLTIRKGDKDDAAIFQCSQF